MKNGQLIWVTIVALLVVLFGWQWVIELQAEEPRRAVVSIEMLLSENYIVPQINGWTYYNKPPVFNWLMVVCFKLFGSMDESVVRLPSLISMVVLAIVNYFFTKPHLGKKVAIFSSFILITAGEVLFYGTMNSGEIDMFYALVVYLQIISIFVFWQRKQFLWMFLISYGLVAVGFLTKGLPSLAFQALTILAFAIYQRKFWMLFGYKHMLGILFFIGLCTAYFYPFSLQDDVFAFLVRQFKEAAQRTGLETDVADTVQQTLSYPLLLAKLMLPWSILLVFSFKKDAWRKVKSNPFLMFLAIFFLANIPIYWFSGDFKPRYLYMFFPVFAVFLAYFYFENKAAMPVATKVVNRFFDALFILLPLGFIAMLFVPATAALPYAWLRVLIMLALGAALAILHFKSRKIFYTWVLLVAFARLGFNMFYLPSIQNDANIMYYKSAMKGVTEIAGDEQVFLCGRPYKFMSDASFGPLTFENIRYETAPLHAYQISYYISRENKKIVQYEKSLTPGQLYITDYRYAVNLGQKVLYEFDDRWVKCKMVMFRYSAD